MSWTTITLLDLNDARVAELVTALRSEELGAGQTDPMPRRIQAVITQVRDFIALCAATPVDTDATLIPASTKDEATEEIIRRLKKRLLQPLGDDEIRGEKRYNDMLAALRDGIWPVDTPDDPIATNPVQSPGGSPRFTPKCRRFTRCDEDGA